MDIKVLGTGCPKCEMLTKAAQEAVSILGVDAVVSKVTKLADIMEYDVMMTPALVINGTVRVSGRVPDVDEIKQMIQAEAQ